MIFMTVFVLGCTGSSTATTGASDRGVVFTEFTFDTSAVYHKESVNLRMVLENQGQKKVTVPDYIAAYRTIVFIKSAAKMCRRVKANDAITY